MIEAMSPKDRQRPRPVEPRPSLAAASPAAIARMRADVRRSVFSQWLTFSRLRQKYCGAILELALERDIPWIVSR
jgi:hypothetical protein